MMGGICKRLLPEAILIKPEAETKEELITALVNLLAEHHAVDEPGKLIGDILEREELASTCLGFGCAVPHAHSGCVETTHLAAAVLDPPLEIETPDGEPVSLLFLMVGPKNSAALHIRLLSKLARLLHDEDFRSSLKQAADKTEFHELICRKDE
jgi:mannitol/fructose-specific phosphotransferase system IIA component (Ntr-type)